MYVLVVAFVLFSHLAGLVESVFGCVVSRGSGSAGLPRSFCRAVMEVLSSLAFGANIAN